MKLKELILEKDTTHKTKFGFVKSKQADEHYAIAFDGDKIITTPAGWSDYHALWTWPDRKELSKDEAISLLRKKDFPEPEIWIDFYSKKAYGGNHGWNVFLGSLEKLANSLSIKIGNECKFVKDDGGFILEMSE